MLTIAASDTLAGVAGAASKVTCTIFGMELHSGTSAETYKVLDQRQLAASAATIYTATANGPTFVKSILVVNTDTSTPYTFQLFRGGTAADNAITPVFTLPAACAAAYEDGQGWQMYDAQGRLFTGIVPDTGVENFGVTGAKAETFGRHILNEGNISALTSGTIRMQAIWLRAGTVITSITFASATTAANGPTNQLFGLYDISRNLLAVTTNDTSTAWAANLNKTLALSSPTVYIVPTSALYYLACMVTASTAVPTMKGMTALTASHLHGVAPILNGNSSTGQTTSLANPAAAITVDTAQIWGCVS
jgi:hypothetical protein